MRGAGMDGCDIQLLRQSWLLSSTRHDQQMPPHVTHKAAIVNPDQRLSFNLGRMRWEAAGEPTPSGL